MRSLSDTLGAVFARLCRVVQVLVRPTHTKRSLWFLLGDTLMILASVALSYGLRFDFRVPPSHYAGLLASLPFMVGVRLGVLGAFGLYRVSWRFMG
ncbi:MAG: hypothetical protein E4H01_17280, partial [Lysobacterales bacterium]